MKKILIKNAYRSVMDNKAFTILETMVAVMILSVVITVMVVVTAGGFNNVNSLKDSLTASYLSQEGIELVRKIRDESFLQVDDPTLRWEDFNSKVDECMDATSGCVVWYNPSAAGGAQVDNYSGANIYLRYDDHFGYFSYASGGVTEFSRQILMQELDANSVEVISRVTWKQGTNDREFETREILYNWY